MSSSSNPEIVQRAPQVCSHCKSIKKGCDKKLPSCSQCIKRRAICRYGETLEPRRYGDEIVRAASPNVGASGSVSTWTSIPRSVLGTLDPTMRLSILLTNSISDLVHTSVLQTNARRPPPSMHAIFYSQVGNIVQTDGQYFESILTRYFDGVHIWLPILSRKRFYDRLKVLPSEPSADFSVLLLAMRLITQHPSSNSEMNQDREILYLATKTLFAQVQAFVPSSLCLVQTGILLAHYENGHGMAEAAYVTIGMSSRMVHALGIEEATCSKKIQGSDEWYDEEEALSTWWGLVICDRIIALNPDISNRPLATRSICGEDHLPLEPEDLSGQGGETTSFQYRYPVSATSLASLGSFGRDAQATYLMEKVRNAIQAGQVYGDNLVVLGSELQSVLGMVMTQTAGRCGVYCGSSQMLIAAMYDLHHSAATVPDDHISSGSAESIRITLKTITRMVIDVAYAFNAESASLDMGRVSPYIAHVVKCANQHIMMRGHSQRDQWYRDFEELKKMLEYYSLRWIGPGQELQRLMQNLGTSGS
ncbi:hypothetical protein B0J14DRAFT_700321 [Halenospora varia]|nr:hypothetical protein B0J14DRAFT_700321 [Halenospora varia]